MFENSEKLLIFLAIALVFLGPAKLAGLGGTLGRTIREFRSAVRGAQEEFGSSMREAHEAFTSAAQSSPFESAPPQALPTPDPEPSVASPTAPAAVPVAASTEGTSGTPAARPGESKLAHGADDFEGPHSLASEPSAKAVHESAQRRD